MLLYDLDGYNALTITKLLEKESVVTSRQGVHAFLARFKEVGMKRQAGSSRLTKRTPVVKVVIETAMREDDETTAIKLQQKLSNAGHQLSLSTTLHCRTDLGWTRRAAYCQMVWHENKVKCLEWAKKYQHEMKEKFLDVVFTDETSIQLEIH